MDQATGNQASAPDGTGTQAMRNVVVLLHSLLPWQRLNVAAFVVSGVGAQVGAVGEPYWDGTGNAYLPMFKDPVLVFGATPEEMARTVDRGRSRGLVLAIFSRDLFGTFDDEANRAAIARVVAGELDIVGIAFRSERRIGDKVVKGLKLLQ